MTRFWQVAAPTARPPSVAQRPMALRDGGNAIDVSANAVAVGPLAPVAKRCFDGGIDVSPKRRQFKTGGKVASGSAHKGSKEKPMKRSRFSEEQIAYGLRVADSGTPVVDVCRQIGVSEADVLHVEEKYGDFGVTELRRLKMLEDGNARLKRDRGRADAGQTDLSEVVRKKL